MNPDRQILRPTYKYRAAAVRRVVAFLLDGPIAIRFNHCLFMLYNVE
jgi:hypothetical protein